MVHRGRLLRLLWLRPEAWSVKQIRLTEIIINSVDYYRESTVEYRTGYFSPKAPLGQQWRLHLPGVLETGEANLKSAVKVYRYTGTHVYTCTVFTSLGTSSQISWG